MDTALAVAAKMAGLEEYRILTLPEQKPMFEKLLEDISGEASTFMLRRELGENYVYYNRLRSVMEQQGIQARMLAEPRIY